MPGPLLADTHWDIVTNADRQPVAFAVLLRYAPKGQLFGGYLDNGDSLSLSTRLPGDYAATCRCVRTMLER